MAETLWFHISQPIEKNQFLLYFRQTTNVALTCLAPFGLLDGCNNAISEDIKDFYINEYRQWEELIARRLFQTHGFQIDRIAASMHAYVEKVHDPQVLEVIEQAQIAVAQVVINPAVVELLMDVEAQNVAVMLLNLVQVLRLAFIGVDIQEYKDSMMDERFGMHVNKRQLTAHDVASTKGCLSDDSILSLEKVLCVCIREKVHSVSHLQFTTLLDIYCDSPELSAAFMTLQLPTGKNGLELLRSGRGFINLVVHPLVSYMYQLSEEMEEEEERCRECLAANRKAANLIKEEAYELDFSNLDDFLDDPSLENLPCYLRTSLLTNRAKVSAKRGEDDRALHDLESALALDGRCATAYSVRAEVRACCGDLAGAAEDALAAFLLTGASDMMLAATAEQASREVCRGLARDEFRRRVAAGADAGRESTVLIAPKDWFVRSYLAGYDCLQSAFQLDYYICLQKSVSAGLAVYPEEETMSLKQGEEDDGRENGSTVIDSPPMHLRDLDSEGLRDLDCAAYDLLCVLTFLLDKVYIRGDVGVDMSDLDEALAQEELEEVAEIIPIIMVESSLELQEIMSEMERHKVQQEECIEGKVHVLKAYGVEEGHEVSHAFELLRTAEAITGVSWRGGHVTSLRIDDAFYREDDIFPLDGDDGSGADDEWSDIVPTVSPQLRARLVNICASLAYLCGDTVGAIRCLRYSCHLDPRLGDSFVKLGSLLVDTDEPEEAGAVLDKAADIDPLSPFVYMHQAELLINLNEFTDALETLTRARELCNSRTYTGHRSSETYPVTITAVKAKEDAFRLVELSSNICALLSVAQFRVDPSNPEHALRHLSQATREKRCSINALLCYGEVLSQVGDSIGGLLIFKKCARIDPTHPLPFVNSARTFTQMGQFDLAIAHIARALELDVSYCMTYVDLAQVHLQRGHTREALVLIEKALVLARHVSEIRDVLTSQRIAATQLELEGRGLYRQPLLEQQDTSVHI